MQRSVAVIGTGAAGLAAALAAARAGAQVTLHEQHDRVGGTTALSGGNAWLPAHDRLDDDSPETALTYLRALALGSMSEAWWCPAIGIPGETIDGAPMFRLILTERARPGTLMVDGRGRRFANEAQNYNDFGRGLQNFDAPSFSFPHVPAWMVFDADYRASNRIGPLGRRDPDPDWIVRADTLGALGRTLDLPDGALERTVERFNEHAARGEDPDFGRGSYPYDRFIGELGPLGGGPYYALRVVPGCLGTKGGPRTDADGRVLAVADGTPIDGLYAAGNAAASPYGMAYPGAGGTLGPALVFGVRAGRAAAEDG
jgi:hypothetical protein